MKVLLENQCKLLQICQSCQAEAPSVENILNEDAIDLCKSFAMTVLTTREFATRAKTKDKPAITLPFELVKKMYRYRKRVRIGGRPCLYYGLRRR